MLKKNVLLVDDDMDEVELFGDLLSEIDSSIVYHYAVNGKDALYQLRNNIIGIPDIIFLDINMPGMNGWECLKELKTIPGIQDVPVVMYSTTSRETDVQLSRKLGAVDFVTKHDNYNKFRREIECLLLPFRKYQFKLGRRLFVISITYPPVKVPYSETRLVNQRAKARYRSRFLSISRASENQEHGGRSGILYSSPAALRHYPG